MNTLLTFLNDNRQRLDLDRYGIPARSSCVILTPRFRASSHVVFLVLAADKTDPVLVAKVPRLAGTDTGIGREANNLRTIQDARPQGFDSIPRVVAFEEHHGRPILIETALVGRPMDRATVRRDPAGCCSTVINWLVDVQPAAPGPPHADPHSFERLVEQPLCHFADVFPLSAEEGRMLEHTQKLVAPLRNRNLPLVLEHGDLCHPNLILLKDGRLGVVDWELAELRGVPACDLFYFLTYAAFALSNARSVKDCLSAFHAAFFGYPAWARPYTSSYSTRLGLPPDLLTPLFVLCWARYVAGLVPRLGQAGRPQEPVRPDTAAWLRSNRYYALWQHAVAHVNELNWYVAAAS